MTSCHEVRQAKLLGLSHERQDKPVILAVKVDPVGVDPFGNRVSHTGVQSPPVENVFFGPIFVPDGEDELVTMDLVFFVTATATRCCQSYRHVAVRGVVVKSGRRLEEFGHERLAAAPVAGSSAEDCILLLYLCTSVL